MYDGFGTKSSISFRVQSRSKDVDPEEPHCFELEMPTKSLNNLLSFFYDQALARG